MCKNLTHPGILHLLGVTIAPFRLISDWMPCGELPGYIRNFPEADRIILVHVHHVMSTQCLFPSTAIQRRCGPLLPSLLRCDSWGHQRGMLCC